MRALHTAKPPDLRDLVPEALCDATAGSLPLPPTRSSGPGGRDHPGGRRTPAFPRSCAGGMKVCLAPPTSPHCWTLRSTELIPPPPPPPPAPSAWSNPSPARPAPARAQACVSPRPTVPGHLRRVPHQATLHRASRRPTLWVTLTLRCTEPCLRLRRRRPPPGGSGPVTPSTRGEDKRPLSVSSGPRLGLGERGAALNSLGPSHSSETPRLYTKAACRPQGALWGPHCGGVLRPPSPAQLRPAAARWGSAGSLTPVTVSGPSTQTGGAHRFSDLAGSAEGVGLGAALSTKVCDDGRHFPGVPLAMGGYLQPFCPFFSPPTPVRAPARPPELWQLGPCLHGPPHWPARSRRGDAEVFLRGLEARCLDSGVPGNGRLPASGGSSQATLKLDVRRAGRPEVLSSRKPTGHGVLPLPLPGGSPVVRSDAETCWRKLGRLPPW